MTTTTIDDVISYLEKKSLPNINNSILKQNNLSNKYKEPIQYVLNKLYKLYNIDDNKNTIPQDFKGEGDPKNFERMIDSINNFKKIKLNELVDTIIRNKENAVNHCLMHGEHTPTLFTVPEDTILIFMAPTNRVLIQDKENYNAFLKLIKNEAFLGDYLKKPDCLHTKNYCFKYCSILYPGQKSFDLILSGPKNDREREFEELGFFPNPTNLVVDKKNDKDIQNHLLSNYIHNTSGPRVYFIYSCRACNININSKLVEVLYYNEDICNFINKNKAICSAKKDNNQDAVCDEKLFSKLLIDINSDNKVPYLDFSPVNNNSDKNIIVNIASTLSTLSNIDLKKHKFKRIFKELAKLHKHNKFFENLLEIEKLYIKNIIEFSQNSNNTKTLVDFFSNKQIPLWISHIDMYFFDEKNNLKYSDAIKEYFNYYKKSENEIETQYVFLRLILGQFMYYYFYIGNDESKKTKLENINSLFTEIIDDIRKNINNENMAYTIFKNIPLYTCKIDTGNGTFIEDIGTILEAFGSLSPSLYPKLLYYNSFKENYKLFAKEIKEMIELNKTLNGGFIKKRSTNKKVHKQKTNKTKRLNCKKY